MNFSYFLAILVTLNLHQTGAFTVEQMRKLAAPIKKDCIVSSNADQTLVNGLKDGMLENNEELKCFLYCVFDTIGTVSTILRLHLQ